MFWDVFEPFREHLWFSGAWLTIIEARHGNSSVVSESTRATPAVSVDDAANAPMAVDDGAVSVFIFIALALSLTILRFLGDACAHSDAFEGQASSFII